MEDIADWLKNLKAGDKVAVGLSSSLMDTNRDRYKICTVDKIDSRGGPFIVVEGIKYRQLTGTEP